MATLIARLHYRIRSSMYAGHGMTTTIIKSSTGNTVTVFDVAGSAFTWQAVNLTWVTWTAVKAANATWQDVRDA